jgi:hypothetical protein
MSAQHQREYAKRQRLPPHSARVVWKLLTYFCVEVNFWKEECDESVGPIPDERLQHLKCPNIAYFVNRYVERFISGRWDEKEKTYAYHRDLTLTYEYLLHFISLLFMLEAEDEQNYQNFFQDEYPMYPTDYRVTRHDIWKMDYELNCERMQDDYELSDCRDLEEDENLDDMPLDFFYGNKPIPLYAYRSFAEVPSEFPWGDYKEAMRRLHDDHLFFDVNYLLYPTPNDMKRLGLSWDAEMHQDPCNLLELGSFEHLYLTPVRKKIAARRILRYLLKRFCSAAGALPSSSLWDFALTLFLFAQVSTTISIVLTDRWRIENTISCCNRGLAHDHCRAKQRYFFRDIACESPSSAAFFFCRTHAKKLEDAGPQLLCRSFTASRSGSRPGGARCGSLS